MLTQPNSFVRKELAIGISQSFLGLWPGTKTAVALWQW